MNPKVNQYLKKIAKFSNQLLIQQGRKLGVRIKQRTGRQQALKLINQLDPKIIEDYLNKQSQTQEINIAGHELNNSESKVRYKQKKILSLSNELSSFLNTIKYIDKVRIQRSAQIFYQQMNIIVGKSPQQSKQDLINQLFGIRNYPLFNTEQDMDKTPAQHQQQKEKQKQKEKEKEKQMQRERQRYESSKDHLEILITKKSLTPAQLKKLIKNVFKYFTQRQKYNSQLISSLKLHQILSLIKKIQINLNKLQFNQQKISYLTLTVAASILNAPAFLAVVEKNTQEAALLLKWIYQQVEEFINMVKKQQIDKNEGLIFLQTFNKYKLIKSSLVHLATFIEIPEHIVLGTNVRQWPISLSVILDSIINQISVGELGGRRVLDRLKQFKELIQLLNDERIQINLTLIEKIVMTSRNCIYWIEASSKKSQLQWFDHLLQSQLQCFFNFELCCKMIKILFINGEASVNISLVIDYFWKKFFEDRINEQYIESMFLLINLTIRYQAQDIIKEKKQQYYKVLNESVDQIVKQKYKALSKKEVIDFIKEEATQFVTEQQRQDIINKLDELQ